MEPGHRIDPTLAIAYVDRGAARDWQGDLDGEIADYDKAISLDPTNAMAHANRGNSRGKQGDLDGNLVDCNKAVELDPQLGFAYTSRGGARRLKGDLTGAIADCTKAIELEFAVPQVFDGQRMVRMNRKGLAAAYGTRASARLDKGDLEGAVDDAASAVAYDDTDADPYLTRGLARLRLGKEVEAKSDFDKFLKARPDAKAEVEKQIEMVKEKMKAKEP